MSQKLIGKRILMVDTQLERFKSYDHFYSHYQAKLDLIGNSAIGLRWIEGIHYDLIVANILMPGMLDLPHQFNTTARPGLIAIAPDATQAALPDFDHTFSEPLNMSALMNAMFNLLVAQ